MCLDLDKIEAALISEHMDNIIYALCTKRVNVTVLSCIEFWYFFAKKFFSSRLETIQKHFRNFTTYKNRKIPQFDLLAAVSEAKIRVYENIVERIIV